MKILLFLSLLVSLASCSVTTRLNKIADKHPKTFAKVAEKEFPKTIVKETIVETKTDSADYKALQTYIGEITEIFDSVTDSLQNVIDSLPEKTKEDCDPYQNLLDSKSEEIKELRFQIKNVRPVTIEKKAIREVESGAKVKVLNDKIMDLLHQDFKRNEKNKLVEQDLEQQKKETKLEKKQKQKWKIFFLGSWILFAIAIFLYNKLKKYEKIFEKI
jgi:hypothetical protein